MQSTLSINCTLVHAMATHYPTQAPIFPSVTRLLKCTLCCVLKSIHTVKHTRNHPRLTDARSGRGCREISQHHELYLHTVRLYGHMHCVHGSKAFSWHAIASHKRNTDVEKKLIVTNLMDCNRKIMSHHCKSAVACFTHHKKGHEVKS